MKLENEKRCDKLKIEYRKRTVPKSILPIIFGRTCIRCKENIHFKSVWEMEVPMYGLFRDKGLYYFGCTECFPNADFFYKEICNTKNINEAKWIFSARAANDNIRDWAVLSKLMSKEEADGCATYDLLNKIELI